MHTELLNLNPPRRPAPLSFGLGVLAVGTFFGLMIGAISMLALLRSAAELASGAGYGALLGLALAALGVVLELVVCRKWDLTAWALVPAMTVPVSTFLGGFVGWAVGFPPIPGAAAIVFFALTCAGLGAGLSVAVEGY